MPDIDIENPGANEADLKAALQSLTGIHILRVTVESADLLTLNTVAYDVGIPEPENGSMIQVLSYIAMLNYGSAAYTGTEITVGLRYSSGIGIGSTDLFDVISAGEDTIKYGLLNYPANARFWANQRKVELAASGGGLADGDGSLSLEIEYKVVDLP